MSETKTSVISGRSYSTMSVYIDVKSKKREFKTYTYNLEHLRGEEFLCRVEKETAEADLSVAGRIVLVCGEGPHVPIAKTRLFYATENDSVHYHGNFPAFQPMKHATLQGRRVTLYTVVRTSLAAQETRERLTNDCTAAMEALGLKEVPREELRKERRIKSKAVTTVGTVVGSEKPGPSRIEPKERTSRSRSSSVAPRARDASIQRIIDSAVDGPKPSKREVSSKRSSDAAKPTRGPYFTEERLKTIKKKLRSNPVSINPTGEHWSLMYETPEEIEKFILTLYDDNETEEAFTCKSSNNQENYLIFDDMTFSTYKIYSGHRQGKTLHCALTDLRFAILANS